MKNKIDLKKAYEDHCDHCKSKGVTPLLPNTFITLFVFCKTMLQNHTDNKTLQHVISWNIKQIIERYLSNPDTIKEASIHNEVTEDTLVDLIIRSHLHEHLNETKPHQ
jgi:hypothetical protein